jgi:replicative DNA helicase
MAFILYIVKSSLPIDLPLFEKLVIYNALFDPLYLESIIEHAKPNYFENKNIRTIFEALSQYYSTYHKIPNTTELKLHLVEPEKRQALKEVVLSFQDIDKSYDKDVLLKNTERFFREKAVFNTVLRTSIEVQSGQIDTTKILTEFEKACSINLLESYGFDYLENIDAHCEELQKVFKVIPSGWKWLDDKIGGGFLAEGKALYVFYGVTNVGKSIFLGNIATNILNQNKTVVLISLEMSEQIYSKRISSQLSQIAMNDLPMQTEPLKQSINNYKNKNQKAKLIVKEFPPKSVTPLQIKGYLERLVRKGIKPDAIVLDYLNLVAPPEKGQNSYEAIKQISEMIRAISYHFNCPVISATQCNRTAYNESNPGLETTSESMGLAHTADAQFSIWTEEEDFELGIIHLGITKNRFGPRECHTVLNIDYPTLTLRDPDDVSKSFIIPNKVLPGSTTGISSISDTLRTIESLDD